MFSTKNKMKIILTISILSLVFSFPSSIFAKKLDLYNGYQTVDTIPILKEMPTNKVESLEKNNYTKTEDQDYAENKLEINQLNSQNELTLFQTTET